MIRSFYDLIFPTLCLYCQELMTRRVPLCPICVVGLELLSPRGRCRRCFSLLEASFYCKNCERNTFYMRRGALFPKGGIEERWILEPARFAKTVAAFFIVQAHLLRFPSFDFITGEGEFEMITEEVKAFLHKGGALPKKPLASHEAKSILFLAREEKAVSYDQFSLESKVFLLVFSI